MSKEALSIGELSFEIRRSDRRKSLGLTVDRNGELLIHAPANYPTEQLEEWTRSRLLWVYQKLAIKEPNLPEPRKRGLETGDTLYYLGRSYRLKFVESQASPVACQAGWFYLHKADQGEADKLLQKWFEQAGHRWLDKRIKLLSERFGLMPSAMEVRDLGNRWGSCNGSGKLYFNWKLLQMPTRLIDYVITHELVHLVEPKHNQAFWATLERIMPDYEVRKDDLLNSSKEYLVF